ncbi:MAG: orotate phosphoribosyltransferase [Clostridia bacterium]
MDLKEKIAIDVAKALLSVKAVFLRPSEPFTWASGIQSPIYCDNRIVLGFPKTRDIIEKAIASILEIEYRDAEILMGTSTAGIPHAAIVADNLKMPMGYVRGDAKTHGRNNRIEGADSKGKKVVVIEDLISTAGSSLEVVDALKEAGADVLGILSIFTYGLKKGIDRLEASKVKNVSLTDFEVLSKVALDEGYISQKEYKMLEKFIQAPDDPSWQYAE